MALPRSTPGHAMDAHSLAIKLNANGIIVRAARNTAIAELAADLPPPVLAELVGIGLTTATRWAHHARRDWSPLHRRPPPSRALAPTRSVPADSSTNEARLICGPAVLNRRPHAVPRADRNRHRPRLYRAHERVAAGRRRPGRPGPVRRVRLRLRRRLPVSDWARWARLALRPAQAAAPTRSRRRSYADTGGIPRGRPLGRALRDQSFGGKPEPPHAICFIKLALPGELFDHAFGSERVACIDFCAEFTWVAVLG